MRYAAIRKALGFLAATPLHPQWVSSLDVQRTYVWVGSLAEGLILDIGCAHSPIRPHLTRKHRYLGIDYYKTGALMYKARPEVFGDAQSLPIGSATVDSVLLLDVLEHLPRPEECLHEIYRVLKDGGQLFLQIPFLYPLHDEPMDFQRLTRYGIEVLLDKTGFELVELVPLGKPLTTAALLGNLAASQSVLTWLRERKLRACLVLLLPLFILIVNLSAWLLTPWVTTGNFMPHGYRVLCRKRGPRDER